MANEGILSDAQREIVYALLERQHKFQEQFMKLQDAISEQANLLGGLYGLDGDTFRFVVDGENVKIVGVPDKIESEEDSD